MRFRQKTILARLVLYIFLIMVTASCNFNTGQISPYVRTVIQEPAFWYLSPAGDKLLYSTMSGQKQTQAIVRDLVTNQEVTIEDCFSFNWLNNEDVYCYHSYNDAYEPFVVTVDVPATTDALQTSLIHRVTAEKMEQDRLLEQANTAYRLHDLGNPDTLLISNKEDSRQFYYVTGIENIDKVLENHAYTTVPISGGTYVELSQKHYSPNGEYYYSIQQEKNLGIYDATTDQQLAELRLLPNDRPRFRIGGHFPNKTLGWAADNSGIYFQNTYSSGFTGPIPPIQPIQKLSVPK